MPNCSVDIAKVVCSLAANTAPLQNMPVTNLNPGVNSQSSTKISIRHTGSSSYTRTNRRNDKIAEIILPVGAYNNATFTRIETVDFQDFLSRRGVKLFEETNPDAEHLVRASKVNVIENDMSNQVMFAPDNSSGSVVLNGNALVINSAYANGAKNYGVIVADRSNNTSASPDAISKFHEDVQQSVIMDATARNDSLSATLDSTSLRSIAGLISPEEGLSNINFSVSSGGSSIKLTFRNLPPRRPARENFLSGIKTITSHYRN